MAISGSLTIEGLEITGSYTNIDSFNYNKKDDNYNINYGYSVYVNEQHRKNKTKPIHKGNCSMLFQTTSSLDPFYWMYNHLRTQPYFNSGSFENC